MATNPLSVSISKHHAMQKSMKGFCVWLACVLALTLGGKTFAQSTMTPECFDVLEAAISQTQHPYAIIPAEPTSGHVVTFCLQHSVLIDHVSVVQNGNHIALSIYDSGFSYGPNPLFRQGFALGSLPAGQYTLDATIDNMIGAVRTTIASNLIFNVTAADPPTSAPALQPIVAALLALLFAAVGGWMFRQRIANTL